MIKRAGEKNEFISEEASVALSAMVSNGAILEYSWTPRTFTVPFRLASVAKVLSGLIANLDDEKNERNRAAIIEHIGECVDRRGAIVLRYEKA